MPTFLGTSAAQAIAGELIKQQSFATPQAVCHADPTTVQQQLKEDETTLGNKSPTKLGKREISESTAEQGIHNIVLSLVQYYTWNVQKKKLFLFCSIIYCCFRSCLPWSQLYICQMKMSFCINKNASLRSQITARLQSR